MARSFTQSQQDTLFTGDKQYELSNHLVNVRATLNDKKIAVPLNDSTTAITIGITNL
ncbi:hypothetical protein [Chitinophaga costaii]|uniref:hypothetical protein n=1 Tax=Chitinophaga costaii TaxID=1335309 RepID=UPI0013FE3C98|nr:hypothetical protein [Chitinophaga costaii]